VRHHSGPGRDGPDPQRCRDIPGLAAARVIESVVGLRPGRREIRLEVDESLLRVPEVHNYGHGGSGVTVGWGCAADVVAAIDGRLQQ
jgi:D-amino-acid oxidase